MDLPSTNIFAMGTGLIQVNDFGDPGTMSASHIDYLIADPTLIPKDRQQHDLDKIVCLPDTHMANDSKRVIADRGFAARQNLRQEARATGGNQSFDPPAVRYGAVHQAHRVG